jgi:hypothetical protein
MESPKEITSRRCPVDDEAEEEDEPDESRLNPKLGVAESSEEEETSVEVTLISTSSILLLLFDLEHDWYSSLTS